MWSDSKKKWLSCVSDFEAYWLASKWLRWKIDYLESRAVITELIFSRKLYLWRKKFHVELPKPDNQQLLMGTRMFEMINLSMPYCRKDVQVSVMCSIKTSSNFSCSYLSTWWTCGLKKSSLGFLLALPDSGFLFCPWRARSSFLESSSWKNAIANPKLNLFQPWQALGGRLQGGAKAHWCCHRCKRSLCNTSCTLLFHLEAFQSIAS